MTPKPRPAAGGALNFSHILRRRRHGPQDIHIRRPSRPLARVTDAIIAELEQGVRPWTKPWSVEHAASRQRFGDDGYAREELVAELGAAFLCADLGIELEPRPDHASYIANWLTVLKSDKRFVFTAAAHAPAGGGPPARLQAPV